MAKKTKFETTDDYGFDSSLDFDMPDFDSPPPKDDRNPATKIAKSTLGGMGSAASNPAFIRELVKKSLPKGYGSAMDMADETASSIKGLYNDVAREIKPVVNDLKRTTNKLLPGFESKLPKKVVDKLKKWSEPKANYASMSAEEQRSASLQMQLGEIFQFQAKADAERDARTGAKNALQEGVEHGRHRDMLGQLDAMRVSLQQMANYQNKVDSGFQRKSLELQFRSYFLAQDSLEESKRFNALAQTSLENIVKNTGLPDFVKLQAKERLQEVMRNKFIDGASSTIFGARRDFMKNLVGNIGRGVKDKARDFADNVKSGIDIVDAAQEMNQLRKDFGDHRSGGEVAGEMAGGIAADSIGGWVGKKIRKAIPKDSKVNKFGTKLAYKTANAPQLLTDYANQDQYSLPERKGLGGKFLGMFDESGPFSSLGEIFRDAIKASNKVDNSIEVDKSGDMTAPGHFSKGASKSITEIIPGYLSRIYREMQIMRTGNDKIELTSYDFASNKFSDKSSVAKRILGDIIGKNDSNFKKQQLAILKKKDPKKLTDEEKKQLEYYSSTAGMSGNDSTRKQVEDLIDEIDPDKSLSPEKRELLGRHMLGINLKGGSGDFGKLSKAETFTGKTSKHGEEFAGLFEKMAKKDSDGSDQHEFAKKFSDLGYGIQDQRKVIQEAINNGNIDILRELGILKEDSDNIDVEKLTNYFYGAKNIKTQSTSQHGGKVNKFTAKKGKRQNWNSGSNQTTFSNKSEETNSSSGVSSEPSNNSELINAIRESGSKSISETINETLLRIEKKIGEGGTGGGSGPVGSGPNTSGGKGNWWNNSIKDAVGGAYDLGAKGVKGAFSLGNKMFKGMTGLADKGFAFGKDLATKGISKWGEIKDVYIKGEMVPRLSAFKLKAGEYFDQASGNVIKSYKDIKGAVVDKDGKFVLTLDEAKQAFIKSSLGAKLISGLGAVFNKSKDISDRLLSKIPPALKFGGEMLKKAYGLLKLPQDVYTKDKPDVPTLLAKTMKSGGYVSRITSKTINNTDDIDGPVYDERGNEVLTAEDFAKGLYDAKGRPIRNGFGKITGMAKDLVGGAFSKLKNTGMFIKNKLSGIGGAIRDSVTGKFSIGGGLGGDTVLKRLTQIRDAVNMALPEDSRFKYDDSSDEASGGTGKAIAGAIGSKLRSFKEFFTGKVNDIYVKGKDDPKIKAALLKAGEYRDAATGNVIKTYKDIKGSVIDKDGNVVLDASEIKESFIKTETGTKLITALGAISERGKTVFGKVKAFLGKVGTGIKSKFKGMFDRDTVAAAALETDKSILQVLKDRLPGKKKHVIGDAEDDGVRDGSYADLMRKKKDLAINKASELGASAKAKGAGLLGGLAGMFGGKKKPEGEEEKKDGALDTAEGVVAGEAATSFAKKAWGWGKKGAKFLGGKGKALLGLGTAATAAGAAGLGTAGTVAGGATAAGTVGAGGAAAAAGSTAAKWGAKGLMKGAGKLLGPLGVMYGAYSTYDDIKQGNYGEAAVDGALTLGGLAVSLGMGAALFNPVSLAVAATAGLGYLAYKHFTKKKLHTLSKVRYAQYGFLPEDKDHLQMVFGLEDKLMDSISYGDGVAKLDELKTKAKDLLDIFDIKLEAKADVGHFLTWFTKRFKPVFLSHLTALNAASPGKKLDDIDGLKASEQKKYFDAAKFPEGPYDMNLSPFPDLKSLPADKSVVTKLITEADAWLKEKLDKEIKDIKPGIDGVKVAGAIAAVDIAASLKPVKVDDKKSVLNDAIKKDSSRIGLGANATMLSVAGIPIGLNKFSEGNISELAAIRYRTYGLKTLEIERVKALDGLEKEVKKSVVFTKGNATWSSAVENVLSTVGALFGVADTTSKSAANWVVWFNSRFLPTYLNYLTAVATATGKEDMDSALTVMKPQQLVDAATAILSTKNVWSITTSPWSDYELNTDLKTTDANLQGLKDKAKQKVLSEEKSNKTDIGLNKSGPNSNSIQAKAGAFFNKAIEGAKNIGSSIAYGFNKVGSTIGGAVFDAKESVGEAFTGTVAKIKGDLAERLKQAIPAAKAAESKYGVPAAISLAQYQLESSAGLHMPANSNNPFGIKATKGQPFVEAMTGEHLNGTDVRIPQKFAAYPSLTDAFDAHGKLLATHKAYAQAREVSDDPNKYADALTGKYATDPGYGSKLKKIIAAQASILGATAPEDKAKGDVGPSTDSKSTPVVAAVNTTKASNPLGVKVDDQAPGLTKVSAPVPVSTPAKPVSAPSASVDPAVAAASSGFVSPRARDLQVQSQYKKDTTADALGGVGTTLQSSLSVQQSQLDVLTKILAIVTIANAKKNTAGPRVADNTEIANAPKVAKEMPKAPVSMSKQAV